MAKARRDRENMGGGGGLPTAGLPSPGSSFVPGMMAGATLVGVAVLVLLSYMNWQETRQLRQSVNDRFAQVDSRLTELSAKSGQAAVRQGPDPNRVYAVKTEGAPTRGPAGAPVTIAEFSDFQ
jgi:protein-disulfide isomerase